MNAALSAGVFASARVYARVDPGAIAWNLAHLCEPLKKYGRLPRAWATVKADAYGHGLARILPGLRKADGLAVMQLSDAYACREAGWPGPILVYGGLLDDTELPLLDLPNLHLVVSHEAQIDWLETRGRAQAPWIWLRFSGDIGLTGFTAEEYVAAYARCAALAACGGIAGIGHLNQYGRAEDPDGIADADARFHAVSGDLPGPRSTSNSATLLRHGPHAANTDWIRPGLALYGASPLPGLPGPSLGLRPAMSLHTRIVGIRQLAGGQRMGYGGVYSAPSNMRIGMVGCGYADGYPRHAPAGTPVLVAGHPSRTLGVVTMDLMTVDLSHLPQIGLGAPVVLWGTPELPVETVAAAVGTIAADLLTSLTPRVPIMVI